MARLELRGVSKTYQGGIVGATDVDLKVEDGELFVIVGASGSGKSTLLRLIAGLETLDSGSVWLDGERIDQLAPRDRDLAMVFQDNSLYPHLDVYENIAFGLRARRVSHGEIEDRVQATALVLGLADCLDRRPATLSGGQRRRVALGRAMVLRPRLFLFDEPFSGLDAPLRASTRAELSELRKRLDATMILVTHDQGEAMALGDRLALIDRGQVAQVGRPLDLYERPASRTVARFLGQPPMSLLPCLVSRKDQGLLRIQVVDLDEQAPWFESSASPWVAPLFDRAVPRLELGVSPEHLTIHNLSAFGSISGRKAWPALIQRLEPMGPETLAWLTVGPHLVAVKIPSRASFRVGERVVIEVDLARASWFDTSTGDRLI